MTSCGLRVKRVAGHITATPTAASSGSRFAGQTCVITGGARGIGLAVAERMAKEGAKNVAIFDVGDGRDAVASLETLGAKALAINVNLTQEADVRRAVEQVAAAFGQIHVLVQSAAITGKTNVIAHEVELDDFLKVFDINVKGMFVVAKAVLPKMMDAGYGRVVNIASIAGKDGNAGMLAYSASKAAVIGLTKVMGKDYAATGKDIAVNSVAPAVVRTAMVEALPQETVNYMTAKIPMGRCGNLDEVAATVAFAASPECSFTTGFCFDFSGGRTVY